ncbi:hypothetical protein AB1N83_008903 [Pleurotus pulmonarius]
MSGSNSISVLEFSSCIVKLFERHLKLFSQRLCRAPEDAWTPRCDLVTHFVFAEGYFEPLNARVRFRRPQGMDCETHETKHDMLKLISTGFRRHGLLQPTWLSVPKTFPVDAHVACALNCICILRVMALRTTQLFLRPNLNRTVDLHRSRKFPVDAGVVAWKIRQRQA